MANGRFYSDGSGAMSYSPDRSRDVDRFNRSTTNNYSYFDPYRQGYYSPRSTDTDDNYKSFPASDLFG